MPNTKTAKPCPKILVVDDEEMISKFVSAALGPAYAFSTVFSGEEALEAVDGSDPFDLILLDVDMPGMTGYELARLLQHNPKCADVPVMFLTARTSQEDEKICFDLGAVDFIRKPISAQLLAARVRTHVALKASRDRLKNYNIQLERRVEERTRELALTQDVTILSLASLAETRDNETGNHLRRTQAYVLLIAEKLATNTLFSGELDEETITLISKSAPMHDIGKVGVPDAVLLKRGKLTAEEFEIIKLHPGHGKTALESAEAVLGTTSFLRHAKDIAYCHHEKWDGSGYPQGLSGPAIPLSARLMAVADVYDALITKRAYKPAFSHDQAVDIIVEGKGSHFDPDVLDAFIDVIAEVQRVAEEFSDDE